MEENEEQKETRTMKKTRSGFINKTTQKRAAFTEIIHVQVNPKFIELHPTMPILEHEGNVLVSGKVGTQWYNKINSVHIAQNSGNQKILNIYLNSNRDLASKTWEYGTLRLKSYGNKELYNLACNIEKTVVNLTTMHEKVVESLKQPADMVLQGYIEEIDMLSKKYPFTSQIIRFSLKGMSQVQHIFSEKALSIIGDKGIENFASTILKNGIPKFIEYHGQFHLNIINDLMNSAEKLLPRRVVIRVIIPDLNGIYSEYDCLSFKIPFLKDGDPHVQFYNFLISEPLKKVEFEPMD